MASKNNKSTSKNKKAIKPKENEIIEEVITPATQEVEEPVAIPEKIEEVPEKIEEVPEKTKKSAKKTTIANKTSSSKQKFKIGSIVFISNDAEADLNGFKLFPQYKKYTYTVEAYDEISGVYTLRRLNLSLRLSEAFILAPDERAHDSLHRRQF